MKGQVPFTIQDALNGPSPGLSITLPQLLDCSPRLRRDLAELLRSSIPRTRKKNSTGSKGQSHPISLHSTKFIVGPEVTSEASPGIEDNIECLYIEAWIRSFKVPEVLVDAGAMLDLVSTKLVDQLRLERFPVSGLGMRLADDRLVVLKHYVWIDVVVIKLGLTATTVWRQRNETVNAKELTPKRSHTGKGKNLFANNNNSLSHPRHSTTTI